MVICRGLGSCGDTSQWFHYYDKVQAGGAKCKLTAQENSCTNQNIFLSKLFYWNGKWGHRMRENSTGRMLCQNVKSNPIGLALSHFIHPRLQWFLDLCLLRINGVTLCFLSCKIKGLD